MTDHTLLGISALRPANDNLIDMASVEQSMGLEQP
jgi:hypothetical protein